MAIKSWLVSIFLGSCFYTLQVKVYKILTKIWGITRMKEPISEKKRQAISIPAISCFSIDSAPTSQIALRDARAEAGPECPMVQACWTSTLPIVSNEPVSVPRSNMSGWNSRFCHLEMPMARIMVFTTS